jgi:hypothetical protein
MDNIKSYSQNRRCLHCNAPIADQEHALRLFCASKTEEDGSVTCCKDDYYIAIRKEEMAPYMDIAHFHRNMHQAIDALWWEHGEDTIDVEVLNGVGIQLHRALERKQHAKDRHTFFFQGYYIEQQELKTFKIFQHVIS